MDPESGVALRRSKATDKRGQQKDLETQEYSREKNMEILRSSSDRQQTAVHKIKETSPTEDESNQQPLCELRNNEHRDSAALTRDSAYISEGASARLSQNSLLSTLSQESCATVKSCDPDKSSAETFLAKSLDVNKEEHGDSSVKTNQSGISPYKPTLACNSLQQGGPDGDICNSTKKAESWRRENKTYMRHTLRTSVSDSSLTRMKKLHKDDYRKSGTLPGNLKEESEMGLYYDCFSVLNSKTRKTSDEESVSSETSPKSSTRSPPSSSSSLKMDTLKSYQDASPNEQDTVSSATCISELCILRVTHKDKCYYFELKPCNNPAESSQNIGEVKPIEEESNNKDKFENDSTSLKISENLTAEHTDAEVNNLSKHSDEDNASPTGSDSGRSVTGKHFYLKLVEKGPGRSTEN